MNKPSRRAVVRTGVWAVPAVATAAAAPAFASGSVDNCAGDVCLSGNGAACKLPGHSTHNNATWYGYRMTLTFFNDSGADQTVTVQSVDFGKGTQTTISAPSPATFTVAASCTTASGGCSGYTDPVTGDFTPFVLIVQSTNSAQDTALVCFTSEAQVACAPVFFPSFNPCKCDGDALDPTTICTG
jgi:hypothetical protein